MGLLSHEPMFGVVPHHEYVDGTTDSAKSAPAPHGMHRSGVAT